jgi:hypothetical protein
MYVVLYLGLVLLALSVLSTLTFLSNGPIIHILPPQLALLDGIRQGEWCRYPS